MNTEELKKQGLTDDQIKFVMAENGKDLKKQQKENEEITADRDNWKLKAESAEETLNKFEGIDPEAIKTELSTWKKKVEDVENDYQKKIYERDFSDAMKAEIENYKFSSDAAKKAIMAEIMDAGLKLKDGKILGLSDLIGQIKEKDASAFVDENTQALEQNRARFTQPLNPGGGSSLKVTREEFAKMGDAERIQLKQNDPDTWAALTRRN